MSNILKNGIKFLQTRFPAALVLNNEVTFSDPKTGDRFKVWPMIAQDSQSGIKHRAVALFDAGSVEVMAGIFNSIEKIFDDLDGAVYVKVGNSTKRSGHDIDTTQMSYSSRVTIYTNKLICDPEQILTIFSGRNMLVEIIDESQIHKTLFISYGGTDEETVIKINKTLKGKGVTTWFFPDDSVPGEKLHRMMHEGVNKYDRVMLVCSKSSLSRKGVLNEIERVLEREANEGGSDILMPVTLDDYVYSDWAPERKDLAEQVRTRVITKIDLNSDSFDQSVERIVNALKKRKEG